MSWRRLGVVYVPDGSQLWARSHAALPTPVHVAGDIYRFFFSSRDAEEAILRRVGGCRGVGNPAGDGSSPRTGAIAGRERDFRRQRRSAVGCITKADDGFLLYSTWDGIWVCARPGATPSASPGHRICRLRSNAFHRAPSSTTRPEDPYTFTYPCVLQLGQGDWRMWYGLKSCAPSLENDDLRHVIKVASSRDGVRWHRDGSTRHWPCDARGTCGREAECRPCRLVVSDGLCHPRLALPLGRGLEC